MSEIKNLSDLMNLGGGDFFPEHKNLKHAPIDSILGKSITVLEVVDFVNDKGPGVAIRCIVDSEMCRVITHSEAVRKILISDDFKAILAEHERINIKIITRRSAKSGREYYCLG